MDILNLRPALRPQDEANFDLQVGDHLRIYNLALRRLHNGYHRILAPNAAGKHSASFHPELNTKIVAAVLAKLGGQKADECSTD